MANHSCSRAVEFCTKKNLDWTGRGRDVPNFARGGMGGVEVGMRVSQTLAHMV